MSATITGRKRLRVTAVQMKFASSIAGNLATIERMVKEAARRRADAVLFPEWRYHRLRLRFRCPSPRGHD